MPSPVSPRSTTSPLSLNNPFHPDNLARRKASSSAPGPSNPVNPETSSTKQVPFQEDSLERSFGTVNISTKGKGKITIGEGVAITSENYFGGGTLSESMFNRISNPSHPFTGNIDVSTEHGDVSVSPSAILSARTIYMPDEHTIRAREITGNNRGLNTKFNVALTFAGEIRDKIESLLPHLDKALGKDNYFYDNRYTDILSQPHLDSLLQDVYKNADLVVVVLSENYANRFWCNKVEYPEVQKHINNRLEKKIMYVRTDDTVNLPEGMTERDGYIDLRNRTPETIVAEIKRRFDRLRPDWHGQ